MLNPLKSCFLLSLYQCRIITQTTIVEAGYNSNDILYHIAFVAKHIVWRSGLKEHQLFSKCKFIQVEELLHLNEKAFSFFFFFKHTEQNSFNKSAGEEPVGLSLTWCSGGKIQIVEGKMKIRPSPMAHSKMLSPPFVWPERGKLSMCSSKDVTKSKISDWSGLGSTSEIKRTCVKKVDSLGAKLLAFKSCDWLSCELKSSRCREHTVPHAISWGLEIVSF